MFKKLRHIEEKVRERAEAKRALMTKGIKSIPLYQRFYLPGTATWIPKSEKKLVCQKWIIWAAFSILLNLFILLVHPTDFKMEATIALFFIGPALKLTHETFAQSIEEAIRKHPLFCVLFVLGFPLMFNFVLRFTDLSFHTSWVDGLGIVLGAYLMMVGANLWALMDGDKKKRREERIEENNKMALAVVQKRIEARLAAFDAQPIEVVGHPV